jgi:hypothetical protein
MIAVVMGIVDNVVIPIIVSVMPFMKGTIALYGEIL